MRYMNGGTDMKTLTPSELRAWVWLCEFWRDHEYGPTLRELQRGIQTKYLGNAQRILKSLEKNRFIELTGEERGIVPIRYRRGPKVLEADLTQLRYGGEVWAGKPVAAFEEFEWVDFSDLFAEGNLAWLVTGKGELIEEGDYIVQDASGQRVAMIRKL